MAESVVLTDDINRDYFACEICREPIHEISVPERQSHYEDHFNNGDGLQVNELDAQLAVSLAQGSSPYRGSSGMRATSLQQGTQYTLKPKENVFWHPGCPSTPPSRIITPSIIPLLRQALARSPSGGALCAPLVVHYGTELWDFGWGCGYRNFLMACSALVAQGVRPEYKARLMNDRCGPPGVRNLQVWIEDAWHRGYDAHGAAQLRHRLVGTRKWIGTAELYVAFVSRGIPARLVDFPNNGHGMYRSFLLDFSDSFGPRSPLFTRNFLTRGEAHTALVRWLTTHFLEQSDIGSGSTSPRSVYMSTRMPVVLQHKGHSRTIVGVEFTPSGDTNVLIYDPARRPSAALRKAGLSVHSAGDRYSVLEEGPEHRRHRSPNKAKDFFRRVVKKRPRTPSADQASKRVRGGGVESDGWGVTGKGKSQHLGGDGEQHPSRDHGANVDVVQGLDLGRELESFRVSTSQLRKKDQYQVLWFPMTPALSGLEQEALQVVRSERVMASPTSVPQ